MNSDLQSRKGERSRETGSLKRAQWLIGRCDMFYLTVHKPLFRQTRAGTRHTQVPIQACWHGRRWRHWFLIWQTRSQRITQKWYLVTHKMSNPSWISSSSHCQLIHKLLSAHCQLCFQLTHTGYLHHFHVAQTLSDPNSLGSNQMLGLSKVSLTNCEAHTFLDTTELVSEITVFISSF